MSATAAASAAGPLPAQRLPRRLAVAAASVGQPWAATSTVRISRRAACAIAGGATAGFAGATFCVALSLSCEPVFKAVVDVMLRGAIVGGRCVVGPGGTLRCSRRRRSADFARATDLP